MKNQNKWYYLGYWIYLIDNEYIASIDNSIHKTLTSAKAHTDYISK